MIGNRSVIVLFFVFCFLITFTVTGAGYSPAFAEQSDEVEQSAQPEKINTREAYRIDVGDVLEINVWKEPELTRGATVRLDGMITLPLIGDVLAADNTPMELAKILEEEIGERTHSNGNIVSKQQQGLLHGGQHKRRRVCLEYPD
jgi:hypothetical protein